MTEPAVESPAALADRLAAETARLAARLAFAIEAFDAPGRFALAAAPVAVVFERSADAAVAPVHRSGRIDPTLLPFLVDATLRTRERLAWPDDRDNPYLIALVLAAFYVVEGARTGAAGLGPAVASGPPGVAVVPPDAAGRDIVVRRGTTALRVIAPVEDEEGTATVAAVELTWKR
jgi:hypothetical protein